MQAKRSAEGPLRAEAALRSRQLRGEAAWPLDGRSDDLHRQTVNLALQGGGAHGAFTWGVLDRLLEDERISFEGICATSAGAMNAVVMASGLTTGGREGARRTLAEYWHRVSELGIWGPLQPTLFDRLTKGRSLETSPAFVFFDMMTRLLSLWLPVDRCRHHPHQSDFA